MLPFLKLKQDAASSSPVETMKREPDEEKDYDGLESAMEELHSAMNSKDYKAAAEIFRAAFELMDSEPHVEGEHTNG